MFRQYSFTRLLLLLAVIATALLVAAAPAEAAVFDVGCRSDAAEAVVNAIHTANNTPGHDIIRLTAGCTYTFSTAQPSETPDANALPIITEALTIEGNGAELVRQASAGSFRFIRTADYVPVSLKNLSLIGGRVDGTLQSPNGGAIYANGGLNLENVYFLNNSATGTGGAVDSREPGNTNSVLVTINGSTFEGNSSTNNGGALFTLTSLLVTNSQFYDNWAENGSGGGIYVLAGAAIIQNSLFAANYAYNGSGGGLGSQFSTISVVGSEFTDNAADVNGGGLFFQSDYISPVNRALTISGVRFLRNEATRGGALSAVGANLALQQSTLIGNATSTGHAVSIAPYLDGQSRIVNNLIVEDTATDGGALLGIIGYEDRPGVHHILHNTIVNEDGSSKPGIYVRGDVGTVNVVNNIVAGFEIGLDVEEGTTTVFSGFNLYNGTDPAGPQRGPVTPYSGGNNLVAYPLFVDSNAGDYRLQAGSPAIDSGVDVGVTTDITGLFRPQGITFDRGAYEYGATNTAPVATADSYSTAKGTTLNVASPGVLANDADADGDTLTAVLSASPSHGTVTLNANGSFSYVPNSRFTGEDNFSYMAFDGQTSSNLATVTVVVGATTNLPPAAADDAYTTLQNTTLSVAAPGVLANDSDPNGDPLSAVLVPGSGPAHGSLTFNSANGSFSYTPNGGYTGQDSFSYRASDGAALSGEATVIITVAAVDSAPTANFTYSATGLTAQFTDQSAAGGSPISAWAWDFGDGSTATVQHPSHTYATPGGYSVTLTVTDANGNSDSFTMDIAVTSDGGGFTLTVTGYTVRRLQKADLAWSGATSAQVDIFRNGEVITSTDNDGLFTDNIDLSGTGSYTYQVCEAGTSICSNEASINF